MAHTSELVVEFYLALARLCAEAGTEERVHDIEDVQSEFPVVVHKVFAVALLISGRGHDAVVVAAASAVADVWWVLFFGGAGFVRCWSVCSKPICALAE